MTPLSSLKASRLPLWSGSLLTAFVFCYGRPRAAVDGAIMLATRRPTGRELGGLLQCSRRMTAAPALPGNVAFSLDGIRTHGLIAPALDQSCGLMPCGKPLRLPFPLTRSANPHGVAHLLAEVSGFRQFVVGACHE